MARVFAYFLLLFILIGPELRAQAIEEPCSFEFDANLSCYQKRSEAVVRIALVQYGKMMNRTDLVRAGEVLKTRFFQATQKLIRLEIIDYQVIPLRVSSELPSPLKRLPSGGEGQRSLDRLIRLWYYENIGFNAINEVRQDYIKRVSSDVLRNLDAIAVASEPQFPGLGLQSGRVVITEQPMEIAWASSDGGTSEVQSDERLSDEWIHEIGHFLGLDHAASKCMDLPLAENRKCCAASPNRDDVMSYCRNRDQVTKKEMFGFKDCNLKHLREKTIPSLLSGGAPAFQTESCD